jgi:5-methylcytosine-specific restriction endonuclease McrA
MPSAWSAAGGSRRAGELRKHVLHRDHFICWLCGRKGADSVDHVVPRSEGGSDQLNKLRAAHLSCNSSRGASPVQTPTPSKEW